MKVTLTELPTLNKHSSVGLAWRCHYRRERRIYSTVFQWGGERNLFSTRRNPLVTMGLQQGVLKFISKALSSGCYTLSCPSRVERVRQEGAQSFALYPMSQPSALQPLSPSEQLSHFLSLNLGFKTFVFPLAYNGFSVERGGVLHRETRGGNKARS